MKKMKKEEEEKSQHKKYSVVAGIRTHELCLQSQVVYPLDHGTLPVFPNSRIRACSKLTCSANSTSMLCSFPNKKYYLFKRVIIVRHEFHQIEPSPQVPKLTLMVAFFQKIRPLEATKGDEIVLKYFSLKWF